MQVQPLLTQSQFLMGIGEPNQFADAFEDCRLPQERAKVALQLKHLVTPAGMGESFHVLIASKDISTDQVSRLSGLIFGKAALPISRNPFESIKIFLIRNAWFRRRHQTIYKPVPP